MAAYRTSVLASFARMAAALPTIHVCDPLPAPCVGEACRAFDGDHPLYVDGDHVSGYANDLLPPDFERFVARWNAHSPDPQTMRSMPPM